MKRGDIFYADLNPTIGSEQGGIRPVLVIQNNIGNMYSPTVVVLPISSAKKQSLPVHVRINAGDLLSDDSIVLTEQIRTVDKCRLKRYVGSLDAEAMKRINRIIKISLGVER